MIQRVQRTSDNIPVWAQDVVELWARDTGRHAKVVWNPIMRCPEVQVTLKPDDPRRKLNGVETEPLFLHRQLGPGQPYTAIRLDELGEGGLRTLLEEADVLSGRGRSKSLMASLVEADRHQERIKEAMRKEAVEFARLNARDERRRVLGNPLVSVSSDLSPES